MSDLDSMRLDAELDAYEERMIEEYVNEENVKDFNDEKKLQSVIKLYKLPYANEITFDLDNKLNICKKLLEPIKTDFMPIQRQVSVFIKLINLGWNDEQNIDYPNILECGFENSDYSKNTIEVSTLIPKKHYEEKLKEIYSQSQINSLQIPLDHSTEYLQELFDIWIEFRLHNKTPYRISEDFIPYSLHTQSYDKTQINRKIDSIKNLLF